MPPSYTCPRCGRTSYNPNDIKWGYCGHCHDWTEDYRSLSDPSERVQP